MKVDIFVLKGDSLSLAEMARRKLQIVGDADCIQLPLASPEDIILQKLDGYQKGDRVSDRQWRDVLGVLKVSGALLDHPYLMDQAEANGLSGLLNEALEATRTP